MKTKKLKELLKESNVWDRKFGESLPTLQQCADKYAKSNSSITEGKDLDQNIIDKIANLTNQNNHTEARVVLAKALGLTDLEKAYHAINTIHIYLRRGNETNIARNALDKKLFKYAKQKFSNYKDIEGAY